MVAGFIVRAKAQTYLRNNSNDNSKSEKLISFGDDNKKGKSNCFPSHGF